MTASKAFRWISAWDLLPVAGFAAFTVLFASTRTRLPERIAVHWGASGAPNRWQNPSGFFIEVAMLAGGVWLMLWSLGAVFQWFARDEAAPVVKVLEPIRACVALGMLVASACLILQALHGGAYLGLGIALSIVCVVTGVIAGLLRMPRQERESPESAVRAEHYRWGLFYVSADDPRLLVPKRFGYGWTLNFAHGRAWAMLGLSLLLPLLLVVLLVLVAR